MTTSTLGYALLALLARQSSTGYELSRRAKRPLGYFWTAQHSQIHSELGRLTDGGSVTWERAAGPGPHDKKVYTITDAGMRDLAAWVASPTVTAPSRSELLLKTYALWTADRAVAIAMISGQLAEHRALLAEFEAAWERVTGGHAGGVPPRDHPDFGNYATLRYGIGYEQHNVDWCEWVIEELGR